VPQLLDIVPVRHPLLHLIFVEATAFGLDAQLALGQVDLAVLTLPTSGSEVRTVPLFEEDLGLVVPRGHPLDTGNPVDPAILPELPLMLPLPGTAYRNDLDAVARAAGVALRPRAEMDSLRLIATLTFEGCGFSVLPAGAMPSFLDDTWTLVPVRGLPPRLVGVAQRRRGMPGAPVRAVLDILSEVVLDDTRTPRGVRSVVNAYGQSAHHEQAQQVKTPA
jgi:DNA-binding transcriptional LysR family regulator